MKLPTLRDDRKDCCRISDNLEAYDCSCTYGPPSCSTCHYNRRCKVCGTLIDRRLKTKQRFWMQPTKSFPEGAPQREEFNSDASFNVACDKYDREWKELYECPSCCGWRHRDCHRFSCPHYTRTCPEIQIRTKST